MVLRRRHVLLAGLSAVLGLGAFTACAPGTRRAGEAWSRDVEEALLALNPVESAEVGVRTNFAESTKASVTVVAHPGGAETMADTATTVHATVAAHPVPDDMGQDTIISTTVQQQLPAGLLELGVVADRAGNAARISTGVAELDNGAERVRSGETVVSHHSVASSALVSPPPAGAPLIDRRASVGELSVAVVIRDAGTPAAVPIEQLVELAATFAISLDVAVRTATEVGVRPRTEDAGDATLLQGMENVLKTLRQQGFSTPVTVRVDQPWFTTFDVGDTVEVTRWGATRDRANLEPIITAMLDRVNA
ncbi:hypothetical protein ACQBAR_09920 [Propionibacteriaceae bacterium Y1685]|uniref:hypothetical protein n=1 Tax=Microlunatus sp. Y1700 TaxID=3418487 RepID=UPI003B797FF1